MEMCNENCDTCIEDKVVAMVYIVLFLICVISV